MTDKILQIQKKETPKICAIDLDKEIIDALENRGLQCFPGTLGSQVKIPNSNRENEYQCCLNLLLPPNLHEYDIVLVDLQHRNSIAYNALDHQHSSCKGSKQTVLISSYPETVFDPRPLSARALRERIKSLYKKDSLIIVFSSSQETVEYHSVSLTCNGYQGRESFSHKLYDFLPNLAEVYNKSGQNINIASVVRGEIKNLLQKYNKDFVYEVRFGHPTKWINNQSINRDEFIPLLLNANNEIVAFIDLLFQPSVTLVFPQLTRNKKEFILELIDSVLPEMFPRVFPFSDQFSWLKSNDYLLPNQIVLLEKKKKSEEEYVKALTEIDEEIQINQATYQFLHNLLTETGDKLVKAVEQFFNWLGFLNIINLDENIPEIKEEDLQIPLERGLLILEVKGIGGTSKDSECSQISKIKHRRSKERGEFDVFALYLVNHQRYLPPTERRNPPFTPHQITDAQSDERGLLTTYELFKLYFAIGGGFVTREDAKNALLQHGLIKFKPSNSSFIGLPLEIHHKNTVAIIYIDNIFLYESATVIVCNDGIYTRAKILEIRVDDEAVENLSSGEVGIRLDCSISKTSELWLEERTH